MRLVTLCCRFWFEIELSLPLRFSGWHLIEIWLQVGFRLYGLGRLVVVLRLLVIALHHDIHASGCSDLLCLMLNCHIGRHPRLTHSLFYPFLTLDELRILFFQVVHRFHYCTVELVLFMLLSPLRLNTQVRLWSSVPLGLRVLIWMNCHLAVPAKEVTVLRIEVKALKLQWIEHHFSCYVLDSFHWELKLISWSRRYLIIYAYDKL